MAQDTPNGTHFLYSISSCTNSSPAVCPQPVLTHPPPTFPNSIPPVTKSLHPASSYFSFSTFIHTNPSLCYLIWTSPYPSSLTMELGPQTRGHSAATTFYLPPKPAPVTHLLRPFRGGLLSPEHTPRCSPGLRGPPWPALPACTSPPTGTAGGSPQGALSPRLRALASPSSLFSGGKFLPLGVLLGARRGLFTSSAPMLFRTFPRAASLPSVGHSACPSVTMVRPPGRYEPLPLHPSCCLTSRSERVHHAALCDCPKHLYMCLALEFMPQISGRQTP